MDLHFLILDGCLSYQKTTISRQTISWINYLYFTLGRIPIWPSREQIDLTMPECFKELTQRQDA